MHVPGRFMDDSAQLRQESGLIEAMLTAGIGEGMEAGNRAPDTIHSMVEKHSDRHRPASHDIVHDLGRFNTHSSLQADG